MKFLQRRGVDSRRRILASIVAGRVSVNGRVVRDSSFPVVAERDRIVYDTAPPPAARQPIYLMLNKPAGVLTTTRDERGRPTVLDLLPQRLRGEPLFPVGRLDAGTEGLLILTNDGDLANRLTHPRYEVEKEYVVTIDRPLADHDLQQLRNGVPLEDGTTRPAQVRLLGHDPQRSVYSVVVTEGKKRQVRRMFDALGYRVRSLVRTRIKDLALGDLPRGAIRPLTARELRSLRS